MVRWAGASYPESVSDSLALTDLRRCTGLSAARTRIVGLGSDPLGRTHGRPRTVPNPILTYTCACVHDALRSARSCAGQQWQRGREIQWRGARARIVGLGSDPLGRTHGRPRTVPNPILTYMCARPIPFSTLFLVCSQATFDSGLSISGCLPLSLAARRRDVLCRESVCSLSLHSPRPRLHVLVFTLCVCVLLCECISTHVM